LSISGRHAADHSVHEGRGQNRVGRSRLLESRLDQQWRLLSRCDVGWAGVTSVEQLSTRRHRNNHFFPPRGKKTNHWRHAKRKKKKYSLAAFISKGHLQISGREGSFCVILRHTTQALTQLLTPKVYFSYHINRMYYYCIIVHSFYKIVTLLHENHTGSILLPTYVNIFRV
jgi:hypothetical protein